LNQSLNVSTNSNYFLFWDVAIQIKLVVFLEEELNKRQVKEGEGRKRGGGRSSWGSAVLSQTGMMYSFGRDSVPLGTWQIEISICSEMDSCHKLLPSSRNSVL